MADIAIDVKAEILAKVKAWQKVITNRYKLPYSYMPKFKQTTNLEILSDFWNEIITQFQINNPIAVYVYSTSIL